MESLKTQNKIRKFCRKTFYPIPACRNGMMFIRCFWKVTAMKGFTLNEQPAASDAVHRSLLPVCCPIVQWNWDRPISGFTGQGCCNISGSALRDHKPQWIFCHEIVETSQLFARTVAPVNPSWLEQLGGHLCTRSYSEPYFDKETGVVRAAERVHLFGMQIAEHTAVSYGKINPQKACAVFIRQGLVEEQLNSFYHFYNHNKMVRREVEMLEEKLRSRSFLRVNWLLRIFTVKDLQTYLLYMISTALSARRVEMIFFLWKRGHTGKRNSATSVQFAGQGFYWW